LKIEFKKVLFYAIAPAIVAGLFSIAPKLYDIVVEPTAKLTYLLSSGPELEVQDGFRKILSIEVMNSGRKPLSNVAANMVLERGQVETHKIQEESGLKPTVVANEREVSVEINMLHPSEKFTISAMVMVPYAENVPRFSLRSTEVLGQPFIVEPKKRDRKLDLLGAILAATSVFVMASTVMVRRKSFASRLIGLTSSKQDVLFYIPARLKLPVISNEMRLIDTKLTYLRMADILLSHGLMAAREERENTIKALKCLLLVSSMAETSLTVIIKNIKILEGDDYSEEEINLLREKATSVDDQLVIRDQINNYIENDLAFLTNP